MPPSLSRLIVRAAALACSLAASGSQAAELISVANSTSPLPPDGPGYGVTSRDGRFVAVVSEATNLVAGDDNGASDIFLVDRTSDERTLISQSGGTPANGASGAPAVSNDGRYVAFVSSATNLVPGDTNGVADVFRKDLVTGTLERLAGFGVATNSSPVLLEFSADASILTFMDAAANWVPGASTDQMLIRVRWDPRQVNAIATDFPMAYTVDVSADARCMVYATSGFPSRARLHVFLTGSEQWMDTPVGGGVPDGSTHSPQIDDACAHVAFVSDAANLLPEVAQSGHGYRRNIATGTLEWVSRREQPEPYSFGQTLSMSGDGRHLTLQRRRMSESGWTTAIWTEYRDMTLPFAVRADWLQSGYVGVADGGVTFEWTEDARAGDLNGYYDLHVSPAPGVRSQPVLGPASPTPALAANGDSQVAGMQSRSESADGRWVFFDSLASNLDAADTNAVREIFVRDRALQQTALAFSLPGANRPNGDSFLRDVSADGRYLLFRSCASNLVAGDDNGQCDLFLADRTGGTLQRVNLSSAGQQADGDSERTPAQVTDDGRYVVFESYATNLAPIGFGSPQVYVRDRASGTTTLALQAATPPNGNSRLLDLSGESGYLLVRNSAFDASPNCRVVGIDLGSGQRECPLRDDAGSVITGLAYATLSADGRFLAAVEDDASPAPVLHLWDRQQGRTRQFALPGQSSSYGDFALSANGRYLGILASGAHYISEERNVYRATIFDTVLGTWVYAPANAIPRVYSMSLGAAGDHAILSSAAIMDGSDLNGHVADVYRVSTTGDGVYGGGWQGGFE